MPQDDVIQAARVLLQRAAERAGTAGVTSWDVAQLAADVFLERDRLNTAFEQLRGPGAAARMEQVWREATLASQRDPALLEQARGRTDLLRVWWRLLLDASDKVARDAEDAERFAQVRRELGAGPVELEPPEE
jgi:hypothetical protein